MKKSSEYILDTTREYSLYVVENRAIPKVTDGLKDGQRKFLWLMRNKQEKIKTISLAGLAIQEGLYIHGDASAQGTIGQLAAPFLNNNPFLEGKGAFGTRIDPYAIGAGRYTYVKKNKFAETVLYKDLDVVPLKENYDGSNVEPVTFLPIIPTVLLNGISGIAVGWSTDILPRSFEDLKRATLEALDGKTVSKIKPNYVNIDSPCSEIETNAWEFTGRLKIVDGGTLHVTELPPEMTLEKFRERLDSYEEKGMIKSYVDKSTKKIDVIINVKRGQANEKTEAEWLDFFKIKNRKTERIVVINWDFASIRQYASAEELVKDFVEWRFSKYIERYEGNLKATQDDIEFWKMVLKCFNGRLPEKLLLMSNRADLFKEIETLTGSTDKNNIDRICNFPTYRWTGEYRNEVLTTIADFEKKELSLKDHLANPKKIKAVFRSEVENLKP